MTLSWFHHTYSGNPIFIQDGRTHTIINDSGDDRGSWIGRYLDAFEAGQQFQVQGCDPGFVSTCPWDLDSEHGEPDGVGFDDLVILLSRWGPCACCLCPCRDADFDGDRDVDFTDRLLLLANWGPCAL